VGDEELRQLVAGSSATSGEDQGFRLQCLRSAMGESTHRIFSSAPLSSAPPQPSTVWISMSYPPGPSAAPVRREVVAGLARQLARCGYTDTAVWLEVYLKNWPALRFWIQQGSPDHRV
jgi:hypothetical protein